ncbi:MAG: cation diffusion facilitator family transporter [Defluviitaleaceae bacterium]|nr:cation diffusion facilitator family transporter [Defluviitaleaceae bacterium]
MKKNESQKAQVFEGGLSVVINAVLFVAKFWVGMFTGSVALMADAWHTMSDSLTSIFVVVAAKLAAKKPDKEHPFGHGRWELVASLIIALILGMIGYEFLTDSIGRFQNREYAVYGTIALVITAVSIIIKEALAQYAFYLGRRHGNPVITADGWHHRTDSLSSVVVLAGIIITQFIDGLWWMDSVLGVICALAIFYAAYKIMVEAVTKILGEVPKQELINSIEAEVKKLYDDDLKLHHFHIHNYISHKELTLHLMLDGELTIKNGHHLATAVEDMIKEKFGMEATIHIEPSDEPANDD